MRISIKGRVRPSVYRSVHPSVMIPTTRVIWGTMTYGTILGLRGSLEGHRDRWEGLSGVERMGWEGLEKQLGVPQRELEGPRGGGDGTRKRMENLPLWRYHRSAAAQKRLDVV